MDDGYRETLQNEYNVVAANWRFIVGSRFVILVFFATISSAFSGAYRSAHQECLSSPNAAFELWAIPLLGMVVSVGVFAMDWRVRLLYFRPCISRGIKIEDELQVKNGHFRRLHEAPVPWRLSQTNAIFIIYASSFVFWGFLFVRGYMEKM